MNIDFVSSALDRRAICYPIMISLIVCSAPGLRSEKKRRHSTMTRMVAGTAPLQATPATTSHFLNLHRLQPRCQVEGLRLIEKPRHHMPDPLSICSWYKPDIRTDGNDCSASTDSRNLNVHESQTDRQRRQSSIKHYARLGRRASECPSVICHSLPGNGGRPASVKTGTCLPPRSNTARQNF